VSSRHSRFCVLVLLACWQVLLASGDDFNLARFLFSPTESESEDLLPLDDPNCDFTRPSETRAPDNSGCGGEGTPAAFSSCSAAVSRTPAPASPATGQLSRTHSNTPLRC
jgi:hypothetical protein